MWHEEKCGKPNGDDVREDEKVAKIMSVCEYESGRERLV